MKKMDILTEKKKPIHSKQQAEKRDSVRLAASEVWTVAFPNEQTQGNCPSQAQPKASSSPELDKDTEEKMALELLQWLDEFPPLSPEDMDEDMDDIEEEPVHHKNAIFTVNLEAGYPTVREAMARMESMLAQAKKEGHSIVRLIHGYGSTGKGGAIRMGVHHELTLKKQNREIVDFLPGEEFDAITVAKRRLLEKYRDLPHITEYGRRNRGITLVLLKN